MFETKQKRAGVRSASLSLQGRRGKDHRQISRETSRVLTGRRDGLLFFIEEGKVKVTVVSKQGKEAVIAILGTVLIRGQRPELRERSFLISRVSQIYH